MATDFGTDIYQLDDVSSSFALVSGTTALAQALYRRLTTPRGGLFYDPNYGFDVRLLLNASLSDAGYAAIVGMIEAECEKDERVYTARCLLDRTPSAATLTLTITTQTGPFTLTLAVGDVTVELLRVTTANA